MGEILLEARNLKKYFPVTKGLILMKVTGWVKAVDGVNFTIDKGETVGLVGESGCGKTTIARLILLLERITSGSVLFRGQDIQRLSGKRLLEYKGSVQAVFQDATSSLDPRMRVRDIISEPILVNHKLSKKDVDARVAEILCQVGLNPASASLYPHEFSGGQRQRIAVARSLYVNPSLVVLDEPVSALDVSIQGQIMNLLKDLQSQFGLTYLLIAHNLAVVKHMSDRICVMYLGKMVERSTSEELHSHSLHPYTQSLHSAALPHHPDHQHQEILLRGEVPSPINPPSGCRFHPRCFRAQSICSEVEPELLDVGNEHQVACHFAT